MTRVALMLNFINFEISIQTFTLSPVLISKIIFTVIASKTVCSKVPLQVRQDEWQSRNTFKS